jgi:hypothetical protein
LHHTDGVGSGVEYQLTAAVQAQQSMKKNGGW